MSAYDYRSLAYHIGHEIVCVSYGEGINVAVECETCNVVILSYDKPFPETILGTPRQKCRDCGHESDVFIQPATVNCDAWVDYKGVFQWWKQEDFESPNFEKGTFMCEKCYSEDLMDIEEEQDAKESV